MRVRLTDTPTASINQDRIFGGLGQRPKRGALYWNLGTCAGGAVFEVGLRGSTARVCLMDDDEYQAYLDGDEYEFCGGFYDLTPVVLEVPYDDHWWIVVDSNPRQHQGHR
ncbi:DUF1883 domain-containing protein [Micromonospora fulviviridis]|uniref:DUF1883 domain-containing protein n=1 Tax=Micromonospora fulviviridis TaxID=47860 RepID=A0ABV2VWP0_9ACTN